MASEITTSEYIKHHLTNATMCTTDNGVAFNKACADAGLNPFYFQMANIRELVSWVTEEKQDATSKAKAMIAC